MNRLVWIGVLLAGCVTPDVVDCGNGLVCPSDTTCRMLTAPDEAVCATAAQLAACVDKAPFDECALDDTTMGRCYDGVCSPAGCGNLRLDPGEQCDDGNTTSRDGCRADCVSTETCGNGQRDPLENEQCDDGNFIDNDGCTSACTTEQLRWVRHLDRSPRREQGAAAYDARRDRIVLFGGDDADVITGFQSVDTWEGTGADWVHFPGPAPAPLSRVTMAFDGRAVLLRSGLENWLYDGTSWERVAGTGDAIGIRADHMMAYDSKRDRVVLFGGSGAPNDTWEWDGATRTWKAIVTTSAPLARREALMAYDPARGVVVLAGGTPANGGPAFSDTWTYNGVTWTNVTPGSGAVPQITLGAMAWDPGSKRLITFGGCSDDTCGMLSATLAWNGTTWTDLAITGPAGRRDFQMVGTPERIYMVGGALADNSASDETWTFENGAWSQPVAPGSFGGVVCNEFARDRVLFLSVTPETWLLDDTGWAKAAGASPTASSVLAYNPITRSILSYHYPGGETWEWNGTGWTDRAPAQTPPTTRMGLVMAFDGVHIVLFGGITPGFGPSNETYIWSGSSWQLVMPAHSPPARAFASVGYDPIRKHLVLSGGVSPVLGRLDDLWTFDGTDWTEHALGARPSGLAGPLSWNPARQRLMRGIWEWDGETWSIFGSADAGPTYQIAVATSVDGRGTFAVQNSATSGVERWELTWSGPGTHERCDGNDLDGDTKNRCADPDCWTACAPLCPPGTSCGVGDPTCGNGTCDAVFETCRSCPMDCTCTPTCGDGICDPGETGCPGDC